MPNEMRSLMRVVESASRLPGLLAVKARLSAELAHRADDEDGPDDPLTQFGLLDDLWITSEGGLMVYRALSLPTPWLKNVRRSGHPYWSTSRAGAFPYNNADDATGTDVLITAELTPTGQRTPDWWEEVWETILHFHHIGEDELRLEPGETLVVRHVAVNHADDPTSPLIGKTLTA